MKIFLHHLYMFLVRGIMHNKHLRTMMHIAYNKQKENKRKTDIYIKSQQAITHNLIFGPLCHHRNTSAKRGSAKQASKKDTTCTHTIVASKKDNTIGFHLRENLTNFKQYLEQGHW
jgi:hypothetical protein